MGHHGVVVEIGTGSPARPPVTVCLCSWCKRVRSADGSWRAASRGDTEKVDAVVNCICPDCFGDVTRGMRGDGG